MTIVPDYQPQSHQGELHAVIGNNLPKYYTANHTFANVHLENQQLFISKPVVYFQKLHNFHGRYIIWLQQFNLLFLPTPHAPVSKINAQSATKHYSWACESRMHGTAPINDMQLIQKISTRRSEMANNIIGS